MRQKRKPVTEDKGSHHERLAAVNERLGQAARKLALVAQPDAEQPGPRRRRARKDNEFDPQDHQDSAAYTTPAVVARLNKKLDQVIDTDRAAKNRPSQRNARGEGEQRTVAAKPIDRRAGESTGRRTPVPAPVFRRKDAEDSVELDQNERERVEQDHREAARQMQESLARTVAERETAQPEAKRTGAQDNVKPKVAPAGDGSARPESDAAGSVVALGAIPFELNNRWRSEISARQQLLDQDAARATTFAAPQAPSEAEIVDRQDAELVGPAPAFADPRLSGQDLSGLESQLEAITHQIATLHRPCEDAVALLRTDLAEFGRSLTDEMPRRAVEALQSEIRTLTGHFDPGQQAALEMQTVSIRHIEEAINSLRFTIANTASGAAVAQLATEVRNLERGTADETSSVAFERLEARIVALGAHGRTISPDLEATIHALSDQLERMQLSHGDQLALGSLEDRIVHLVEKLDASDARLGNLAAIERGMADLLLAVEDIRGGNRPARTAPPEAAPTEAAPPAPPALAAFLAAAAEHRVSPAAAPLVPEQAPLPRPPAHAPEQQVRRPIDPSLTFDTPLEPGSGMPGNKQSAAARLAGAEAAGGPAAQTSDVMAAARQAAKLASAETSATGRGKRAAAAALNALEQEPATPLRQRLVKHGKTLVVASSVVIIILGALQATMDYAFSPSEPMAPISGDSEPGRDLDSSIPPAQPASPPRPQSSLSDPWLTARSEFDVTGSIARPTTRPTLAPAAPALVAPAQSQATLNLPASFSATLRQAALAKEPAAEYEIAQRYAEGRGVPQNIEEAMRWLDRSAASGFAQAQFRLASIREKGDATGRKDPQEARRLYLAAAEKGLAKAMHNLAVLHAEGIDGKPDYKVATHWFRRAAAHGVSDSQYNLAILYARGIGVEQHLGESYKWFALAAARGDTDAAKKRDEVGSRLDKAALDAAKAGVAGFVSEHEPDEATSLRAPAGGWDRVTAAAPPARPRARTQSTVAVAP